MTLRLTDEEFGLLTRPERDATPERGTWHIVLDLPMWREKGNGPNGFRHLVENEWVAVDGLPTQADCDVVGPVVVLALKAAFPDLAADIAYLRAEYFPDYGGARS